MASATVWKFEKGMTCLCPLFDRADDRAVVGRLHHNHAGRAADQPGGHKLAEALEQSTNVPAGRGWHGDVIRQVALRLLPQLEGGQLVTLGADGPVAGHDAQVALLCQSQHCLLHERVIRGLHPNHRRAVEGHSDELLPRRELGHEDQHFEARPRAVGGDRMAHVAGRDGRRRSLAHLLRHEDARQRAAVLEAPGGVLRLVLEQQALDAGKGPDLPARIYEGVLPSPSETVGSSA